jgi:hypothetical protein
MKTFKITTDRNIKCSTKKGDVSKARELIFMILKISRVA